MHKSTLSGTVFLLQVMCFAKLNKPLLSFKPPSLLSPPSKVLEKNKPPGGLNRGFTVYEKIYTKQNNPKPENKIKTNKLFYSYCFYTHHGSQNSSSLECWLLILTISRHNLEKILPTNSLRKCMEISLENLYVDIEA